MAKFANFATGVHGFELPKFSDPAFEGKVYWKKDGKGPVV